MIVILLFGGIWLLFGFITALKALVLSAIVLVTIGTLTS